MEEYFNVKQRKDVVLKENQKPSKVVGAVEAAWRAFTLDMKPTFLSNMANQEKGHQEKKHVLALTVIINISSKGGGGSTRMTTMMRKKIM